MDVGREGSTLQQKVKAVEVYDHQRKKDRWGKEGCMEARKEGERVGGKER